MKSLSQQNKKESATGEVHLVPIEIPIISRKNLETNLRKILSKR